MKWFTTLYTTAFYIDNKHNINELQIHLLVELKRISYGINFDGSPSPYTVDICVAQLRLNKGRVICVEHPSVNAIYANAYDLYEKWLHGVWFSLGWKILC